MVGGSRGGNSLTKNMQELAAKEEDESLASLKNGLVSGLNR